MLRRRDGYSSLLSGLEDSADVQERGRLRRSERVRPARRRAVSRRRSPRASRRLRAASSSVAASRSRREDRVRRLRSIRHFASAAYDEVEELIARIDSIPPGRRPPSLRAQSARFRARLAAARGEHEGVEQGFKTAAGIFREHGLTFPLAVTELEHGEWLVAQGRGDEAEQLLAEAREIFERLEATPWIERCRGS